jgi:LysM repeat protein
MRKTPRDPRLIGFLVGFGGVSLIGLIVVVALGVLRDTPSPTLVPTIAPISERVTVVPSASGTPAGGATPSPLSRDLPTPTSLPVSTKPSPTPSRAEPLRYTVREGDTLFDIALAHSVSVETIQAANELEGETITPGQVLTIPTGPLPTPTPYVEGDLIVHTVSSGETLIGIAEHYSVTVEAILAANDLDSEVIQPGWELRIPVSVTPAAPAAGTPTEAAPIATTTTVARPWQPSILEGDLETGYPLTVEGERFTMHYQPDTPAARAPNRVAALVESALNHVENKLQVTLEGHFDVYVAGSLFAPPDSALRGRSFSSQRRNFYLYDDTGTPDERRYIITHELTHLVIWNTVGRPSSVMLHEGLAVYTGVEAMEAAGFIPLSHFCAAYQQAGQLPRVSGGRDYLGHIRDLDLYFAAGCFVEHLIETYGVQDFKQLFTSGDYAGIYGRTLTQLEAEWVETLDAVGDDLTFAPDDLVTFVGEVADAYDRLFADFGGTPAGMAAYRELDQARIAVLQGRFDEARSHLDEFEELLKSE